MQIEFQNKPKDYIDFFRYRLLKKLKKEILPIIIFSIIVGIAAGGGSWLNWNRLIAVLLIPTTWSIIYLFRYFAPINAVKSADIGGSYTGYKTISTTEEGLTLNHKETKIVTEIKWKDLFSFIVVGKMIYLELVTKKVIIIPKDCFVSDEELARFLNLVKSHDIKTQKELEVISSSKPYYWVGFLCFIPLIGAFVGITMILNGIFNHKNKWLVIMGVGGIAFTIFFYYYNFRSDHAKSQWIPSAKIELNKVVKSLEDYKKSHGEYPDSIQQIKTNEIIGGIDPILAGNSSDCYFYYKKVGDRYYLFSKGVDGVANTSDDIYPDISGKDTAKTGLIIK